ncbi:MAG: hypothetical protein H6715_06335 [Myxococcales bacterium]|nr:hypothetical protein [Myxococcales bacterium]MCB9709193.1 hypothetical protein [Myxococcales bacterium]
MGQRLSWDQICSNARYIGRWLALGDTLYDQVTGHTKEAAVLDVDDDLAELCERLGTSQRRNCAIVFCGDTALSGAHATGH